MALEQQTILIANRTGKQVLPMPNLTIETNISEPYPRAQWHRELGIFLNTNPTDAQFRLAMNKKNSAGFWVKRPLDFASIDQVDQVYPHLKSVGNHIYDVVQNLNTEISINGINYLLQPKRAGIKKALRFAALYHDYAKKDDVYDIKHPEHSAFMAESFLREMEFTPEEVWMCHFLIKHHDLIGKTINRTDPTEVNHLVKICHGYPAILQSLWALTIADISSIPELQKLVSYNLINDINLAAKMALKEIMEQNSMKSLPTFHFPKNIKLFPFE